MSELGGTTRKKGQKERPSEKKAAANRAHAGGLHPGKHAWSESEAAARIKAVRMLRHMTPSVVEKIAAMLEEKLEPIELAALARVVFDRGGVPAVSELELKSDQPITQTLVITYAERQAMLQGQAGASDGGGEHAVTNGTNGTAH